MTEGSEPTGCSTDSGSPVSTQHTDATVLLFTTPDRDRDLLGEVLRERYTVSTAVTSADLEASWDLCIVDSETFERHRESLRERTTAGTAFSPVLVIQSRGVEDRPGDVLWDVADDVMEMPVRKPELAARVENLLKRRWAELELIESRNELAETVEELHRKERAMDAAPIGISISDPRRPDNPLVYVNEAFERLTGYESEEVLGRSCRFLQGPDTDPETVSRIRAAIDAEQPVSADVLNYRRDGSTFWNKLDISPVSNGAGTDTFVGFQADITDRKIREQRLSVMNRLLTHNLRNSLTVIEGYADLLAEGSEGTERGYADQIVNAAADLERLSEEVHRVERGLSGQTGETRQVDVDEVLRETARTVGEREPGVDVSLDVPSGDWRVECAGLSIALTEAIENALRHNDSESPSLTLSLADADRAGWVTLAIEDNGSGLPALDVDVLTRGEETPLKHAEGIGLWLVQWVVSRAGGEVSFRGSAASGTVIRISLPSVGESTATTR